MADQVLVRESPQNDFLDSLNKFGGTVGGFANQLAGAYSTFLGAKTAAKLNASQNTDYQYKSTSSSNPFETKTVSTITYAAVGLAVLGTLVVIYRAFKK